MTGIGVPLKLAAAAADAQCWCRQKTREELGDVCEFASRNVLGQTVGRHFIGIFYNFLLKLYSPIRRG